MDVRHADAELELRADLVTDRRLDIDRADVGEVADEPAWRRVFIPLGLQGIGCVHPQSGIQLRAELMGEIDGGDGADGAFKIALLGQKDVGTAPVRADERHAAAEMGAGRTGYSRWIKEDRR